MTRPPYEEMNVNMACDERLPPRASLAFPSRSTNIQGSSLLEHRPDERGMTSFYRPLYTPAHGGHQERHYAMRCHTGCSNAQTVFRLRDGSARPQSAEPASPRSALPHHTSFGCNPSPRHHPKRPISTRWRGSRRRGLLLIAAPALSFRRTATTCTSCSTHLVLAQRT